MQRPVPGSLLAASLLLGCTSMGAWLYDDPAMSLQSVTVRPAPDSAAGSADSIDFVFLGCNRNDYDLMSDNFSASLAVSGRTIAAGMREQPVFLGTRDTSSFVVTIPLQVDAPAAGAPPVRFELLAQGVLRTPIGNRDVTYRFKGKVETVKEAVRWLGEPGFACRPGLSTLPGVFDRRTPLSGDSTDRSRPPETQDPNRPGAPREPTYPASGSPGSTGPGGKP